MRVGMIEDFYYTLLYIFYIMYFLVVLNLAYFQSVTMFLPIIQSALKYFVVLFLMFRFNPYSHEKFTEFDKQLVFSSSLFLLSTMAISDVVLSYFNKNVANKIGIDIKKM
jgi:phosphatidylserine/phosphatidylglycerophosphate/cardiolipin synthase-like enzyme